MSYRFLSALAALVFATIPLSAGELKTDRAYTGPERPRAELAVFSTLKSGIKSTVHKIDGEILELDYYRRSFTCAIEILPGRHSIELSVWGKGDDATVKKISFEAKAGIEYWLDGKTMTLRAGKDKGAPPVDMTFETIPYHAEPASDEPRAIIEKGGGKGSFILFRIDGKAGHPAMNGNARFNNGFDDGAFTVAVTPGTHVLEFTATAGSWSEATGPKSATITVEAGKTYELVVTKTVKEGVTLTTIEK